MVEIGFDRCVLDVDRRELHLDGDLVEVQRQVFDVLAYLVVNADRVVPKDELLDEVWGDRFVSESTLTTRIKEARRAVGDDGARQAIIKTIHGVGYRFVAEAHQVSASGTGGADRPAGNGLGPPGRGAASGEIPRPRTRYADGSGASIAYQRFGDGPDLVVISGFTTNVELLWESPAIAKVLGLLGSFARVTLFDKRGVGCSERLAVEQIPGLDVRMDDLLAVMDHAGIDRANLVGTSEGGSLAAVFAATHPERVERLALHGTWAQSPEPFTESAALVEEHWGKGFIYGALSPRLAEAKEGRRHLARYERQSATPRLAASIVELLATIDVTDILGAIRVPTMIIHSPTDEWVPFGQAEILEAGIPGSTLVELSHPDHYLFSCEPGELVGALRSFLDQEEAGPGSAALEHQLATVLHVAIGHGADPETSPMPTTASGAGVAGMGQVASAIETNGGRVVEATGDALTATFDTPGRALRAATAISASVEGLGLSARMGLHCAEVQRRGDAVTGVGVDIASCILDKAGPGEIWVSRTITDLVAGNDLHFVDRGEHQLAEMREPWRLFSLDRSDG